MAVAALVVVARTQREEAGQGVGTPGFGGRSDAIEHRAGQVERGQFQMAGMVHRRAGAQAAMAGDELHGAVGVHRATGRAAAVGVDAAGHVQRKRGRGCASSALMKSAAAASGARDRPMPNSASTSRSASPSAPSNVPTSAPAASKSSHARCASGVAGGCRRNTQHRAPRLQRMQGEDVSVAAVVAGPAGDHDAPRLRATPQHAAPPGLAGTRHQRERIAVEQGGAARFDFAQRLRRMQREGAVRGMAHRTILERAPILRA